MPNRVLLSLSRQPAVRELIGTWPITRSVVQRFVAGNSMDDALAVARELEASGIRAILDYLGENMTGEEQADAAAASYLSILDRISTERVDAHISVKLTQLGLHLSFEGCLGRIGRICAGAAAARTTVAIDMESHEYTDRTIETYRRLAGAHGNVVLCLQAYLKRTPDDVASLLPLRPAIRLCKGAYNEPDETAFGRGQTRMAFRRLLGTLLPVCPYTVVATHDEFLVRETIRTARRRRVPRDRYEFQMLYGVRRDLQARLARDGNRVRVYIPFGEQWYPYLMRRMAERPANLRLFLEALVRG